MLRILALVMLLAATAQAQLSGPVGLVYGPRGELYIAETGRERVIRADGRVLADGVQAWGLVRIGDEIACSEPAKGRILWLGNGAPAQLIGGLNQPTGMAWNPDSKLLYVVERGGRLLEIDPFASEIMRVVSSDLAGAEGICCTKTTAYVTQPAGDRVTQVDLTDGTTKTLAEDIELPTGIALGDGSVYVASGESGQVIEVSPGHRRVMAELSSPGLAGLVAALEPNVQPLTVGIGPLSVGAVPYPEYNAALQRKIALTTTNLVSGALTTTRVSGDPHPKTLIPAGLTPAGSLRYELESRIFVSGLTQAELDPTGLVVHAPLLRAIYSPTDAVLGIVDSALDGDGNVYYSLTEGGRIVTGWGGSIRTLAEGLQDPAGIAVDNQGLVFVAEAGAGRVSAILGGGETLPLGTDLGRPVDLAYLPGQGLMVVDEEGGRLFLLASDGPRVLRSDLKQPVAIARLPDGNLAVVEAGADRVLRLAPDGTTRKTLFTSGPGELLPPRMSWRVLGGLAADPISGLLYISVPGKNHWVTVPL